MTSPQIHEPIGGKTAGLSVAPGRPGQLSWAGHMAPMTKTARRNGLCFVECSGSQHFTYSYSDVLFQPDIEMLLKNYVQDLRGNIFTSNQRGLGSCHKRQCRERVSPGLHSVLN